MAVFDFLKKKEGVPPIAPQQGSQSQQKPWTPSDYVRDMRSQGYADTQIVEALRQQGYPETMVMDALNQAEVKGPATDMQPQPSLLQSFDKPPVDHDEFEQIAEAIVNERWQEIKATLDKRKDWEEQVANEMIKLKQEIVDCKSDLNNLHKAIVSKISDYDQNLLSVGTEIKAMEKVFQKILPDLTSSVGELSRITEGIKKR